MALPAIDVFTSRGGDVEARVAAAAEVGGLLATEWPLGLAWAATNRVLVDESDVVAVRCAAARALSNAPAAAPNQLVRGLHDPARAVRKEAIAVLRSITVPPQFEARLHEQLAAAEGPDPVLALLNLALTFGHDERIVRVYERSTRSADADVRAAAVRGLAMLGYLGAAIDAVNDPAVSVRVEAASVIGGWSTLDPAEIDAARTLADDPDPAVKKMARKALRLLSVSPVPMRRGEARSARPVDPFGWAALLERISNDWIQDRDYAAGLDHDVIDAGWLGRPPVTVGALRALEARVGKPLPPSYAGFLQVSNGFARVSFAIDEVFAAADVRPFAAEHADWIAAYGEHDPPLGQLLSAAWQVSEVGDGVLLLHPDVVNAEGEWAASLFANWIPGLDRHESFLRLIAAVSEP